MNLIKFTTDFKPAIININKQSLISELQDFGYMMHIGWDTNQGNGITAGYGYYITNTSLTLLNDKSNKDYIQCGTNKQLFLAIAALARTDDYCKWFVWDEDVDNTTYSGQYISTNKKGTWFKNPCRCKIDQSKCHLATIDELIEHFKGLKEMDKEDFPEIKIDNHIEKTTCALYRPDGTLVGVIENLTALYDVRVQIKKSQAKGYYLVYKDQTIKIDSYGNLEDYPEGFFEKDIDLLNELCDLDT